MDWTQTLTIILSVFGSTAAVWYVVREDIKRHDLELKEMRQEFHNVRTEMKEEFSKGHALWANLLKQIYDIKLDQSQRNAKA